ncbi:secreted serine protease [Gigaspora margarita]|uniref:Secreted serine protease n=1 Tax=Gigaspora margarita TaxID=4874 RepID=A0A8H4ETF8_GIGMA|nr:secreted serine protease [Gigaspora margarita]
MPRQTIKLRVLGGDAITELQYQSSAGFWVRSGKREYLLTVGHAANSNHLEFYYLPPEGELDFTLIGQMVIRQTSGVDMGYIMKNNNTEGVIVCKSGFSTHVTCGKIAGIRDSISRQSDGLVLYDVVISDMECREGDSGGPVYQYLEELLPTVLLVGMVFGGGDDFCLFHPVRTILLPDMQVIVA